MSLIKTGKSQNPNKTTIKAILDVLGVTVDELEG